MNIRRAFFISSLYLALGACQCAKAAEPEIVGSVRFSNQVQQALLLLRSRDTNAYAIVTNYVGRIEQGERSGMWAYKTPPTYEISDSTAFYSLTWCAATIAHDSFHSKLYHDHRKANGIPVPDAVWTGKAAERRCMKHQLLVMEQIGASKWEIDYAKTQADGHYAKDNETWQDYKKRIDNLIPRLAGTLTFITNAIVCAAAIQFYQRRARRSVLLIAISAGVGALVSVVSWMAETPSPTFWALIELAGALDLVLWTAGICMLFREFAKYEKDDG